MTGSCEAALSRNRPKRSAGPPLESTTHIVDAILRHYLVRVESLLVVQAVGCLAAVGRPRRKVLAVCTAVAGCTCLPISDISKSLLMCRLEVLR